MQHYNIFQALFLSFFSKDLYRDVAKNWGGKTFLYLFFLIFLSWLIMTYQIQQGLNQVVKKDLDEIINQIPILTIEKGKLITPENRPYIIVLPQKKEIIGIVDTSGTYKTLDEAKGHFLFTKTEIITRSRPNETKIIQLPSTVTMVINPIGINNIIKKFLGFLWLPLLVIFVLAAYVYRLIQSLIYALIGKIFAGRGISYAQILQITMVALTPAVILGTIFDALAISFTFQYLLYFLLSLFYLFFGIKAAKITFNPISKTNEGNK